VPFYFQLKRLLEQEIVSGRWQPGDRLRSEAEICDAFGLSRSTVRQALALLESEGLVVRSKGRGTFVGDTRSRSWLLQSSDGFFHDEVDRMGRTVTSRVVRAAVEPLRPDVADALALPEGSEGVTLERLRYVDDRLALYVVNHLPRAYASVVLDPNVARGSLYERLAEEHGVEVVGARRVLEAVVAADKLAGLLEVERGAPLLYIESTSWDRDLHPFDFYRAWLRTDRMKIEVQVASAPGRQEPQ
jgi:GntR family transcriptional regulator